MFKSTAKFAGSSSVVASVLLIDPTRNDARPNLTSRTTPLMSDATWMVVDTNSTRPINTEYPSTMRTFDRAKIVESSSMDDLQDRYIQSICDCAPTSLEADCAIEVMRSRPELIDPVLPAGFDKRLLDRVFDKVRDVLVDPDLVLAMRDLMKKKQAERLVCSGVPCEPQVVDKAPIDDNPIKETPIETRPVETGPIENAPVENDLLENAPSKCCSWDELRVKFRCCICLDVFAAPVLTKCLHSFCGKCITDYYNTADADIVLCPLCTNELDIDALRGELHLAQVIEDEVNLTPRDSNKTDWEARRDSFLASMKQKEREQEQGLDGDDDDLQEKDDGVVFSMAVFALVAMAFFVIGKYR